MRPPPLAGLSYVCVCAFLFSRVGGPWFDLLLFPDEAASFFFCHGARERQSRAERGVYLRRLFGGSLAPDERVLLLIGVVSAGGALGARPCSNTRADRFTFESWPFRERTQRVKISSWAIRRVGLL